MKNTFCKFQYLWIGLFFLAFSVSYTHADEYITDDSLRSLLQTSIEHQLGDPERSLSLATLALESGAATRLPELLPDLHLLIAHNYYDLTQMDSALLHYEKVTHLITEENNPEQLSKAFNGLGNCNYYFGNSENAWKYYEKSLQIATNYGITTAIPTLYNNLGNIFMDQDADEKALEYYRKAYDFATETLYKAHFSNNVGLCYQKMDSLNKALSWYEKSKALYDQIDEKRFSLTPLYNIALIQFDKQEYDKALSMYLKLSDECIKLNLKEDLIHIYNRVGLIYNLQGRHYEALHYHKKCLELAEKTSFRLIGTYYSDLAKTYDSLENYQQALLYLKEHNALKDSLNTHEKEKVVSEMITRYESREKAAAINRLEIEKQNLKLKAKQEAFIRNAVVIVASLGFAILLILLIVYRKKLTVERQIAIHKEEEQRTREMQQRHQNEIDMMKVRIESQEREKQRIASHLHDNVAGTLAGVKQSLSNLSHDTAGSHRLKLALKHIGNACLEVSTLSTRLSHLSLGPAGFTTFLKKYCQEVSLLNGIGISFIADSKEDIEKLSGKLKDELLRIIREAVNNIIKHAEAQRVDIRLTNNGGILALSINDDGKGFTTLKTKGLGLGTIQSRVETMQGHLKLKTAPGKGTRLLIELPLSVQGGKLIFPGS